MSDPMGLFVKEDAPAKSMRRMRFVNLIEVHKPTLLSYIKEAVALNVVGRAANKVALDIPADLTRFLAKKKLSEFFRSLSYTHQKEYVRWIGSAKKDETRKTRILKTVEMLTRKIKHP